MRRVTRVLLVFLLASSIAHAQTVVQVTDDAHHTLTVARPARRVISLAPSVTELLYEAGAGDRLVGTVDYSDYPPEARKVPRIGNNQELDLERIASLRPDLVLVWFHGNATRQVEQLGKLGIPMFYVDPHHVEDIPGELERIGQVMGTGTLAQAAAQRFRARYASLRARYAERPQIRVFYQVAVDPLLTINDQQIISDVIHVCGGSNVFGRESSLLPSLSTESVVAANPDVILTSRWSAEGANPGSILRSPEGPGLKMWTRFSAMKAVKTGQLWLVPGDLISRQGPRILDGAQAICTVFEAVRRAQ
jgi:iron complex transport system substrate-binding protein